MWEALGPISNTEKKKKKERKENENESRKHYCGFSMHVSFVISRNSFIP
jgi:hypothetical protein